MKSVKPEEFFRLVSVNSGVSDLQTVKDIYYGLIRTMSKELRGKQVVALPDWGEFVLKIYPARKYMDVNDRKVKMIQAKPVVKFSPHINVKKYFYSLGEEVL